QRDWPGFPATMPLLVPPSFGGAASYTFDVPDTAADGLNTITFELEQPNGLVLGTCSAVDTIGSYTVAVRPGEDAHGLALRPVWPTPRAGVGTVAFSLPSAGAASLEAVDLGGRRVLSRTVGELGPGTHQLSLGPQVRGLPVGVYALRLNQGGRSLTTKLAIV